MYIGIDNETGGIGADKVSLLTAYFGVYDKDLNLVDELDLLLKPKDGIYKVEGRALDINKINLIEHDKSAQSYEDAGQVLFRFLAKNSNNGEIKLIPVGHNVTFDLLFIHTQLLKRAVFEQFTSYRKLDTSVIAQFLKLVGELPEEISGSLDSLASYYSIPQPAAHTGKGDVDTTIAVLKAMIKEQEPKPYTAIPGQGARL